MAAALAAGGDLRFWRGEKLLCGDRQRDSVVGNLDTACGGCLVRGRFVENNSGGTTPYDLIGLPVRTPQLVGRELKCKDEG